METAPTSRHGEKYGVNMVSIWFNRDNTGIIMFQYGYIWFNMVQYGLIWFNMVLYGLI